MVILGHQCSVEFVLIYFPRKLAIIGNGAEIRGFAYTDEQQRNRWGPEIGSSLILESTRFLMERHTTSIWGERSIFSLI